MYFLIFTFTSNVSPCWNCPSLSAGILWSTESSTKLYLLFSSIVLCYGNMVRYIYLLKTCWSLLAALISEGFLIGRWRQSWKCPKAEMLLRRGIHSASFRVNMILVFVSEPSRRFRSRKLTVSTQSLDFQHDDKYPTCPRWRRLSLVVNLWVLLWKRLVY